MKSHPEVHLTQRSNWLRAAVLGAADGILSTSSLVLGVAASGASGAAIITAGVAGLVAGALSMAAGSTCRSSQRDSERAYLIATSDSRTALQTGRPRRARDDGRRSPARGPRRDASTGTRRWPAPKRAR